MAIRPNKAFKNKFKPFIFHVNHIIIDLWRRFYDVSQLKFENKSSRKPYKSDWNFIKKHYIKIETTTSKCTKWMNQMQF